MPSFIRTTLLFDDRSIRALLSIARGVAVAEEDLPRVPVAFSVEPTGQHDAGLHLYRGTFEIDVVVIDGEPARLLWKGKVFDAEGYEHADYDHYDFEDDFMKKLTDTQRFVEGCYRLENLLRQAREKLVELVSGVYSDFP